MLQRSVYLALGHSRVRQSVVDSHCDPVGSGLAHSVDQQLFDPSKLERQVSAGMLSEVVTIHPDLGVIVNTSKSDENFFSAATAFDPRAGDVKLSVIPSPANVVTNCRIGRYVIVTATI